MTVASGRGAVAIVTPWYPTRMLPFRGAFVRAMVEATAPGLDRMTVIHCDRWSSRASETEHASIDRAHRALLSRAVRPSVTVGGAGLRYLPVPIPAEDGFAGTAVRHEATLRADLNGDKIDAAVVHVHEGLPSGWAVLDHLHPDTRLFVTEHASFLERLLEEPEAMDDPLLARAVTRRGAHSLRHVFRLVGLVQGDPKALEVSYEAVHAGEAHFRAVGLEYLENILPPDVRDALWPLIGDDDEPKLPDQPRQSMNEAMQALLASSTSLRPPDAGAGLTGVVEVSSGNLEAPPRSPT